MRYAKILTVGDPILTELFTGKYAIEEKIDGSQFRAWAEDGQNWKFGSKGVDYNDENPVDKMFAQAVANVQRQLTLVPDNWSRPTLLVFEYLQKPRHNTLEYSRVPRHCLVLLDVFVDGFPSVEERERWARALDFETPLQIGSGDNVAPTMDVMNQMLEEQSMLGGCKIEGIVIKNYEKRIHVNAKTQPIFAKYVREEFKELNKENWGDGEKLEERIMKQFPKEPRWVKAVQHLREKGELTDTPKDIGKLMEEIQKDFEEECKEIVKEDLWNHYKHVFLKMSRAGFPEKYKEDLLKKQLGESQ